ncbi:MAG: restriction endonuclease [Phycisphaerae bacterium]|nr:restriction endonuclease [Phycisphaerae bacterium]
MSNYENLVFKIPVEGADYPQCSEFITTTVDAIIEEAIERGRNKIIINTNLKLGLPMENINKIAGPFVEAWAVQTFSLLVDDANNCYRLINVEAKERLYMADIILQFKREAGSRTVVSAEVDVKATAEDIESSGKSPNITSFVRIRTAYVEDADYLFLILSLKHRVYCKKNGQSGLMDGVMEVVGHKAYDLKFISSRDMNYNPALGNGQMQIRDIHYVSVENRTTWEFCQLLDRKYLGSSKRSYRSWLALARKYGWIKYD